jgi:hypothetical protein
MNNDICAILIIVALIPLLIAGMHTILERPQPQAAAKRRLK